MTLNPSPNHQKSHINPYQKNISPDLQLLWGQLQLFHISTLRQLKFHQRRQRGQEMRSWRNEIVPVQGPIPPTQVVAFKWGKPNDPNQSERYMYENSKKKKKESVYIEQICCLWEILWRMEDLYNDLKGNAAIGEYVEQFRKQLTQKKTFTKFCSKKKHTFSLQNMSFSTNSFKTHSRPKHFLRSHAKRNVLFPLRWAFTGWININHSGFFRVCGLLVHFSMDSSCLR